MSLSMPPFDDFRSRGNNKVTLFLKIRFNDSSSQLVVGSWSVCALEKIDFCFFHQLHLIIKNVRQTNCYPFPPPQRATFNVLTKNRTHTFKCPPEQNKPHTTPPSVDSAPTLMILNHTLFEWPKLFHHRQALLLFFFRILYTKRLPIY